MKEKKISLLYVFKSLGHLLITNCRLYLIVSVFICVVVGLATASHTLIKQWFFESVEALAMGGFLSSAIWWGTGMGVLLAGTLAVQGLSDVLMENLGLKLSGFLGREINEKAAKVDPICFENTDMLNDINKAYQGVQSAGVIMQIAITNFAFYIPYFVFLTIYLFVLHPVLCFGILLVFVPTLGGQFIRTRFYTKLENTAAPIRRRMDYYERCMVDREYAKETRLLGAVCFFRTLYETAVLLFKKEQWKTRRKSELVELGLRLTSLAVYVIILWLLYYYLKMGVINTAIFAAVFTSIDQLFNYMDYVGYGMGEISYNLPLVKNALRFLQLPERYGEDVSIKEYAIQFDNVSFSYPNSNQKVINHLNLNIRKGETIAIVGENGAGKSTLVKLMTGLYLPTEGEILIDNYSTKEISQPSIYRGISAVFQKYQRYKMKLTDNVSISQTQLAFDNHRLSTALIKADLPVEHRSFTHGLETMLSREFDGTDLSGGQWQRIAIGRGFYRDHEMIILDEPTAAIDPVEETQIYRKFAELSKDKTAVIVTHRLGSAKIADRIIVMDGGEIIGIGTHEELMAEDGLYRRMYESQAKWYA
jgi:ATP-binding cassette subfamily B protein